MRVSNSCFKTYREAPADAELNSHKLLVRAGYIKKQGAGIYAFLPLGVRVMRKLNNLIREEMDNIGFLEVDMPKLLPEEVYATRVKHFGSSMFRLKDRNNKDMCLGPTHEEVFTSVVKDMVTSYKQLPVGMYQIGDKFRDEMRPRFGLQRAKEFVMKDAYSYHVDTKSLDEWYNNVKGAYYNVFNRLGLDFVPVDADNGAMGGSGSQEFMVKSNVGEDEIVCCTHCDYAANVEKAESVVELKDVNIEHKEMKLVDTPKVKTIDELCNYLNVTSNNFVKAVVYSYESGIVVALVRGDREVEDVKLVNLLGAIELNMATSEQIAGINSVAGYVGATNELKNAYVVADNEIKNMTNFVIGANKIDKHYINANLDNLVINTFADIRKVQKGDKCPKCGAELDIIRGIEVGHIFKLGTRYTKELDCKYLDEAGREQIMQMGCYGIGVSRTMSACVEQMCDDNGIVWPEIISPYKVIMIVANMKNDKQVSVGEELYSSLQSNGIEILYDDRKESLGVKFKDAELIGIPNIIVVGRDVEQNQVELVDRKTGGRSIVDIKEIINILKK